MSTPNDGGPAFPCPDTYHPSGQIQYGPTGMSLRDWFAGQAPVHDLSQMIPDTIGEFCVVLGISVKDYRAEVHYMPFMVALRYKWADAMLKEREKKS
jgi:hypothetical protein